MTGKATVAKPTEGSAWAKYRLTVCKQDDPAACLTVPDCNVAGTGTVTVCPIEGAVAQTTYSVKVTALEAGGTASAISAAKTFTTPQHA